MLHCVFLPPFIYIFLFSVLTSLSPPSLLLVSVISVLLRLYFSISPFCSSSCLAVWVGRRKGGGLELELKLKLEPALAYILFALHTNSEELAVGVVDAGGSGGLTAVVAAITAVEAEQAAGRVISSR